MLYYNKIIHFEAKLSKITRLEAHWKLSTTHQLRNTVLKDLLRTSKSLKKYKIILSTKVTSIDPLKFFNLVIIDLFKGENRTRVLLIMRLILNLEEKLVILLLWASHLTIFVDNWVGVCFLENSFLFALNLK